MKIWQKGVVVGVIGMCLVFIAGGKAGAASTQEEINQNGESVNLIEATVVVPEEEVMATVASVGANGWVVGDGVRLRKSASSTAAILELMYNNEKVAVDPNNSVIKSGVVWFYLRRIKTGTWGFANGDYIFYNG